MTQFEVGGSGKSPIDDATADVIKRGRIGTYSDIWKENLKKIVAGLLVAAVVTSLAALARG